MPLVEMCQFDGLSVWRGLQGRRELDSTVHAQVFAQAQLLCLKYRIKRNFMPPFVAWQIGPNSGWSTIGVSCRRVMPSAHDSCRNRSTFCKLCRARMDVFGPDSGATTNPEQLLNAYRYMHMRCTRRQRCGERHAVYMATNLRAICHLYSAGLLRNSPPKSCVHVFAWLNGLYVVKN
jgi:hypothetical protein